MSFDFGLRAVGRNARRGLVAAAGAAVVLLVAWVIARRPPPAVREGRGVAEIHAPRVSAPIPIDGEVDGKTAWQSDIGSTGVFKDAAGNGMVPYSEARVRWRDGTLYLWLYAGDLDLEGSVTEPDGAVLRDDAFHVEIGAGARAYTLDVSVLGTLSDAVCDRPAGSARAAACDARWQSGAAVAVDRDGTLNQVGDNDEEWVVEMAIPLAAVGIRDARPGTRIPFAVRRCDVRKGGGGSCGAFGMGAPAEIVLEAATAEGAVASAGGRR